MRLPTLLALAGLLALAFSTASARAEGPDKAPTGRAYAAADLEALVEGLGYDAKRLDGGMLGFIAARPEYTLAINLSVSADGSKVEVWAPLRKWKDLEAVPEDAYLGLLRKTAELGPTRAYLAPAADGGAWVGLVRTLDNRSLRPADVREQIDLLFPHARLTEDLWNPERWTSKPAPAAAPGMDAGR